MAAFSRIFLLAIGCWILQVTAWGQNFTFNTATPLPDTVQNLCMPLAVQGLPVSVTSDTFGLASVCINITHTYTSDLEITLKTPLGQEIPLVRRIGGAGNNFIGTCLAMDGITTVNNASAPFTGVFIPQGDLNEANRGLDPNGVWRLCISDQAGGDIGVLNSFSLTFSRNPPVSPPPPPTPCSFSNFLACDCPDGSDTCDLLPDMKASSRIMELQRTEYVGRITISNATPNIGYGPLEIHGTGECYCDTVRVACDAPCPTLLREKVVQTIYHKTAGTFTTYNRPAGYMAFHPTHGHVHMEEWSQFTLRRRTAETNPLRWPIVSTGHKISFCLINLANCENANGYCMDDNGRVLDQDSMPNSGLGRVTGCGRDQGIWPGKADIYDQNLDGQEVPLQNVCNGTYYLVSFTDPNNNVLESNDSNNVAFAPITLTRQPRPIMPGVVVDSTRGSTVHVSAAIPPGLRYVWDFGDGTVDSTNNPAQHAYATAGSYQVKLTIHYPCGSLWAIQQALITTNRSFLPAKEFALSAEPNPAQGGRFTLNFRKPTPALTTITLYDIAGRPVRTFSEEGNIGQYAIPVQAADLPAGVYTVRLTSAIGSASVRLMLQ